MITMDSIIGQIEKLPPVPHSAARLAQIISSSDYNIDECAIVIRYDQALATAALRLANSVFSASKRPIVDIRDAVIRLGAGRILRDMLAVHLRQSLSSPLPEYGYPQMELWRHSLAAALAVEVLGGYSGLSLPAVSFTAALLHDIGKLVLSRAAPKEDMQKIWKKVSVEGCTCEVAEKELLGFSHAEAGAAVMRKWGLPESVTSAVENHHLPNTHEEPCIDYVMVANIISRSIGEGIGHEGMGIGADAEATKRLNLSQDKLEIVCMETKLRLHNVLALFGLNTT